MASAAITPTSAPVGMVDDILAYVDSIGEPTGLVGWSSGAYLALAVRRRSPTRWTRWPPLSLGC